MDNVIKKAIRDEIERYNQEKQASSSSDNVDKSSSSCKTSPRRVSKLREDWETCWKEFETKAVATAASLQRKQKNYR